MTLFPQPHRPKIIYIAGFRQHAGKTTTGIGLIASLLNIFKPSEIGYIKPVGQEMVLLPNGQKIDKDAKLIQRFCLPDLDMERVSPVKIVSGVTKNYLSAPLAERRALTQAYRNDILQALAAMGDKKVIIAEGTGHPGVGSVVGLSNADICKLIGADILYLAGGGLGKTLDMLTTDLSFFFYKGVPVSGVLFNKLIPEKIPGMKQLLTDSLLNEMYAEFRQPLHVFGFLPEIYYLGKPSMRLLAQKFTLPQAVGDPDEAAWTRPLNRFKIISLPYEQFSPEAHIQPQDLVLLSASSQRRLQKIIRFNETLSNKIAGLILTCSEESPLIADSAARLEQARIPALFVREDTAKSSLIIENSIENTKLQIFDDPKIEAVIALFKEHFLLDKFIETYHLL